LATFLRTFLCPWNSDAELRCATSITYKISIHTGLVRIHFDLLALDLVLKILPRLLTRPLTWLRRHFSVYELKSDLDAVCFRAQSAVGYLQLVEGYLDGKSGSSSVLCMCSTVYSLIHTVSCPVHPCSRGRNPTVYTIPPYHQLRESIQGFMIVQKIRKSYVPNARKIHTSYVSNTRLVLQ
jgi:hypothetical protein